MLELTDFGKLLQQSTDKHLEDENYKSLEAENILLKQQIEELKQKLEEVKEISFKEGYQKATQELTELYEKQKQEFYQHLESEFESKLKQSLESYSESLNKISLAINDSLKQILDKINELITDSLEDILNFILLNYHDPKALKESISSLIEELEPYKLMRIKVGSHQLEEILKKSLPNVEIIYDETLELNDFRVEFEFIKVENNTKEKLQLVKDEIKREIKKLSEV